LILGAGLAGMVAALELRQPGGRNWSLRGGDSYTELGGATQQCEFDAGLYLNPGPWRIPYHHNSLLDYCKRLGVKLEPFQQLNHNAYLHSAKAFGGQPRRIREIKTDFQERLEQHLAVLAGNGGLVLWIVYRFCVAVAAGGWPLVVDLLGEALLAAGFCGYMLRGERPQAYYRGRLPAP
jgi:monoamine oxidase